MRNRNTGRPPGLRGWAAIRLLLVSAMLALAPARAWAAVEIVFYSREFGSNYPHAFVVLKGILDRTGEQIDANYGFTATQVSPAILMGSVRGKIDSVGASYVAKSDPHFSFVLSDEEYDDVLATVERWRTMKQPSYNLDRRNCVYFIADVAAGLGMKADTPSRLMKKPRSFTESLSAANRAWLEARGARFLR